MARTTEGMDDETAMRLAIAASQTAMDAGNMPFGAALLSADGELLHVAGNNQRTSGDFSGHAETALLREASMRLGREALQGTVLFASGEPCPMCAGALFWAGVRRLVFAATQQDINDCLGGDSMAATSRQVLAGTSPAVIVDGPLLREEAIQVLRKMSPP